MAAIRSLAIPQRRVTLRELRLFLHASRLVFSSQQVAGHTPIEGLIRDLVAKKRLPNSLEAEEAVLATARAGQRLQALGLLNTCLIRSLVTGALLSDRDGLNLHLGIQKGEGSPGKFDGHSWLTLGSQILPHADETLAPNGEPYAIMASFPMRRP